MEDLLTGAAPPADLEITYSDLHPWHGGETLTLTATALRIEELARGGRPTTRELPSTPDRLRALLPLLVQLRAWEQAEPDRAPYPDESRAALRLRAGGREAVIWEWYNDLGKNKRIARVAEALRQLKG